MLAGASVIFPEGVGAPFNSGKASSTPSNFHPVRVESNLPMVVLAMPLSPSKISIMRYTPAILVRCAHSPGPGLAMKKTSSPSTRL